MKNQKICFSRISRDGSILWLNLKEVKLFRIKFHIWNLYSQMILCRNEATRVRGCFLQNQEKPHIPASISGTEFFRKMFQTKNIFHGLKFLGVEINARVRGSVFL